MKNVLTRWPFALRLVLLGAIAGASASPDPRGPDTIVDDHDDETTDRPLAFEVQYVYRSGGRGALRSITDGSVLRSGDHYKIQFQPQEQAYVYIFQTDSSAKVFSLFPARSFDGVVLNHRNPVRPGHSYVVPADGKSFKLDQRTGQESIYFFALRRPDPILEQIAEKLHEGSQRSDDVTTRTAQTQFQNTVKRRGPATVVDDSEDETVVHWDERNDYLMSARRLEQLCANCVNKVTFEHR